MRFSKVCTIVIQNYPKNWKIVTGNEKPYDYLIKVLMILHSEQVKRYIKRSRFS